MPSVLKHSPFFFVSSSQISNGRIHVEGADARHLAQVRRAKPADRIHAGDGRGRVLEAAIETVEQERVEATIVSERSFPRPFPEITVFQGLARQSKIDFAVQKLVELGVDRIVIFAVSRSVPRWDEAKMMKIRRRWERICHEASKQSRRAWLPRLDGPLAFDLAVAESARQELSLVADPGASRGLRSALPEANPGSVGAVVGPEGGLAEDEVKRFAAAGGKPVSIGEQILRAETAGMAIAAMLMFHFGRLG